MDHPPSESDEVSDQDQETTNIHNVTVLLTPTPIDMQNRTFYYKRKEFIAAFDKQTSIENGYFRISVDHAPQRFIEWMEAYCVYHGFAWSVDKAMSTWYTISWP